MCASFFVRIALKTDVRAISQTASPEIFLNAVAVDGSVKIVLPTLCGNIGHFPFRKFGFVHGSRSRTG